MRRVDKISESGQWRPTAEAQHPLSASTGVLLLKNMVLCAVYKSMEQITLFFDQIETIIIMILDLIQSVLKSIVELAF